ncbi:MAG: hypothetical protein U0836_15435 [Pirellulales bacterium]
MASDLLAPPTYTIRRLCPADAQGVADCVREIYGATYVHPELYRPEEIVRLNETLELVSVVALDALGQVVGHYALERPELGPLAETGEALVLPEHRHHQLMEEMRELLEAEAQRLQLTGLFGNVVTNHVFSQRVVGRFGEFPTALSLGWSPASFHNLPEALPQRMSEVVYFKFLGSPPPQPVSLPPRHAEWCRRIWAQLERPIAERPASAATGDTELDCQERSDLGRTIVRVRRIGPDATRQVVQQRERLIAAGLETLFVELPLADQAAPELCDQLEAAGFFFSGLGPAFAPSGDVLRLQWQRDPLDPSLVKLESPLARELLDYVVAERRRVGGANAS